ncbi:MAG: hypothetical protein K940chlam7_00551 [Chlamydiae bacterium]|nr:hypothetical protein [Chlamydiota bacterium]
MPAKTKKTYKEAQNPLLLRAHRLMEAFAKSNDERDFYLDRIEGFIIYVDLDKSEEELATLGKELEENPDRYCMIPKLTFYETKKIMEGFVNDKVYDIDTKEKLIDIIQSKEARDNFLEFIYDHHSELEKWQQYYQERSRIRIIEWLRNHHFHFVFEEDLDLTTSVVEKLKHHLFDKKVKKDVDVARKALTIKAKTYYSNEALNPRPKRGRPPKQAQKIEMSHQITTDIYNTVPPKVLPFLFTPEISSALDVTFSTRFETGEELLAHRKQVPESPELEESLTSINQKLATLRQLSSHWVEKDAKKVLPSEGMIPKTEKAIPQFEKEEELLFDKLKERKQTVKKKPATAARPKKMKPITKKEVHKLTLEEEKVKKQKKAPVKRIIPKKKPATKAEVKKTPTKAKAKTTKKVTKKPAKRLIRKIIPKKPVAKPKAKIAPQKTTTKKKILLKRTPIKATTKAKTKTKKTR